MAQMIPSLTNVTMQLANIPNLMRDYQQEMYERSLAGNTIVTMETGSGKTLIAIYRINDMIERGDPGKLAWFLTPTIELCYQHVASIKDMIPAAKIRLLIGEDGIDHWSTTSIWNEALKDVQVVVSTYSVLHDALSHGFVKMRNLALLIIDEAHHCTKKHPIKMIMDKFYCSDGENFQFGGRPSILGLTASPAKVWKPSAISVLESNLRARCVIPRIKRHGMQEHVHRPELKRIEYPELDFEDILISLLVETAENSNDEKIQKKISALRKKLKGNIEHVLKELGSLAAVQYIDETIQLLQKKLEHRVIAQAHSESTFEMLALPIMRHAALALKRFLQSDQNARDFSPKLEKLIEYLCESHASTFSALVFVKRRIVAALLTRMLANHSRTKDTMTVGTYVGLSNVPLHSRDITQAIVEIPKREVLQEFRLGDRNIIVTTDALEEGIDIAGCDMVVCFDPPSNLKSFIQRRGRARKKRSVYTVFVPEESHQYSLTKWQGLEEEMLEQIKDSEDEIREAREREDVEEFQNEQYRVKKTGACISTDNSTAHVSHFCAKLLHIPYTSSQPHYSFDDDEKHMVSCKVRLPASVIATARTAESSKRWKTERAAKRDAALQVIKLLHAHELLADSLLPLEVGEPELNDDLEKITGRYCRLQAQFSPWLSDGKQEKPSPLFCTTISFSGADIGWYAGSIKIWTYSEIRNLPVFQLFAEDGKILTANFGSSTQVHNVDISVLIGTTRLLTYAARSTVDSDEKSDLVAFLSPDLPVEELEQWVKTYTGSISATNPDFRASKSMTLVQSPPNSGGLYIFQRLVPRTSHEDAREGIECTNFPKRRRFLRDKNAVLEAEEENPEKDIQQEKIELDVEEEESETAVKSLVLAAESCAFRRLPIRYAWTSRLIPSIFYRLEMILTGRELQRDLLTSMRLGNVEEITTAITCPITTIFPNYERLEYLGDTVLKFLVTRELYLKYPLWHEGYLTRKRNSIIANVSLAEAGIKAGLDRYILENAFRAKTWRVPSISDLRRSQEIDRHVSMKVIADVVEALIGVAYRAGGFESALACMTRLEVMEAKYDLKAMQNSNSSPSQSGACIKDTQWVRDTQSLLGITFRDQSLLFEALTHPSCFRSETTESYQRLEFLGDAVLDMIVSAEVFAKMERAPPGILTRMKAAIVNADFLAYLCLGLEGTAEHKTFVLPSEGSIESIVEQEKRSLWMCMRSDTREVKTVSSETATRFQCRRGEIAKFLHKTRAYPWTLFASLQAPKFLSDIVESMIGAIFVDSRGSLDECRKWCSRLGILDHIKLFCTHGFDIEHPKDRLYRIAKCKLDYRSDLGASEAIEMSIFKQDVEIAKVSGCISQTEAVLKASEEALKWFDKPDALP